MPACAQSTKRILFKYELNSEWKELVNISTFAFNTTPNTVTQYSPYELLRKLPYIPGDILEPLTSIMIQITMYKN